MREQRREAVQTQWGQHMALTFPPRLRGEEIHGIDMVMLDADIAGCVTMWLQSYSDLDEWPVDLLHTSLDKLDRGPSGIERPT